MSCFLIAFIAAPCYARDHFHLICHLPHLVSLGAPDILYFFAAGRGRTDKPFGHDILSVACIPISPQRHVAYFNLLNVSRSINLIVLLSFEVLKYFSLLSASSLLMNVSQKTSLTGSRLFVNGLFPCLCSRSRRRIFIVMPAYSCLLLSSRI